MPLRYRGPVGFLVFGRSGQGAGGRGRIRGFLGPMAVTVVTTITTTIIFKIIKFMLNRMRHGGITRSTVNSTARRTAEVMGRTIRATRGGGERTVLRTGSRVRSLESRTRGRGERHETRIRQRRHEVVRGRRSLSGGARTLRTGRRTLGRGIGATSGGLRRIRGVGGDRFSVLRGVSNCAGRRTGALLLRGLSRRLARSGTIGVVSFRREAGSRRSTFTHRVVSATVRHYTTSRTTRTAISIIALPGSRVGNHVVNHRNEGVHALRAVANISLVVSSAPRTVAISDFRPIHHRVTELAVRGLVSSNEVRPTHVRRVCRGSGHRVRRAVHRANRHTMISTNMGNVRPRLIGVLKGLGCHADCNRGILGRSLRISCVTKLVTTRLNTSIGATGETKLLRSVNGTLSHRFRNSRISLNIRCTEGCGRGRGMMRTVRTRRNSIRTGAIITYLIRTTSTVSTTEPNTEHRGIRGCVGHLRGLRRVTASFRNIRGSFTVRTNHRVHVVIGPRIVDSSRVTLITHRIIGGVRSRLRCPNRVGIGVVHRGEAISCTGWFLDPSTLGEGALDIVKT